MSRLTADQLAEHLISSTEKAFPKVDTVEVITVVTAMLFLKYAAAQPEHYEIHDHEPLRTILLSNEPDRELSRCLEDVAHDNAHIMGAEQGDFRILFDLRPFRISAFAESLSNISFATENLEFPDTVGTGYDRFLSHVIDTTGKLGSAISTPNPVVELMIRIASPRAGESVCDPFAGLGGFLTHIRDYVQEISGGTAEVDLFGQELNRSAWILAKLNLLLHGIDDCELIEGDTLANPALDRAGSRLRLFDRVLTHAPFSMNYDRQEIRYRERMRYGWPSEHGRADLLVVQHVLATVAARGLGAVLVPLGVLFRSGPEAEIRRGMISDDRIDAVIGLGPNILPGTGIPACVLVVRGPSGSQFERAGDVLFINAEKELTRSRGINRLDPEAIEKIVDVFRERVDLPGFSRSVSPSEIEANDFNLSVRSYTDQGQSPEKPADAAAIISGGVPRREVAAAEHRFRVFGIDPAALFSPEDSELLATTSGRLHFYEEGYAATAAEIGDLAAAREQGFMAHCQEWWALSSVQFAKFAETRRLLIARPELIASFASELLPDGLLDEYQLRGIFATWWSAWHDDLRVLERYGFLAVLDRWAASGAAHARTLRGDPRDRVLSHLGTDLITRTRTLVVAERQKLVDIYRSWGERYGTSLLQLEEEAEEAGSSLKDRLRKLGYADP